MGVCNLIVYQNYLETRWLLINLPSAKPLIVIYCVYIPVVLFLVIIINLSYCDDVIRTCILQVTADMKLDTHKTDGGDPSRQPIMDILDMFDNCDVLAHNSSEWGICWIHDGKNYPTHHIVKFYITISCNV